MTNLSRQSIFRDTNGNLSIVTGVVGVMLVTAIGASLDGGRMFSNKQKLQSISDAAALMATQPAGISEQQRIALAEASIRSHVEQAGGLDISDTTIEVRENGGQVYVALSSEVPLIFAGVLGADQRKVRVSSLAEETSSATMSNLSISLVLDLSSSMQDRFDTGSKIASVNAAVSDVLNMVESNFGGEAAAATQISTGLYPFNWGMVDGETVALEPGTGEVLGSMSYLSLSEGSVSASAMEQAVNDQIAEASDLSERDRYIVYITDGRVDDDKSDVLGQFLDADDMFADGAKVNECVMESKRIIRADRELEPNLVGLLSPVLQLDLADLLTPWNPNEFIYASPGCRDNSHPHHPSNFRGRSGAFNPSLDRRMSERVSEGKHEGHAHARENTQIMASRLEVREDFLKTCQPTQTVRVVEACERAREEGISIIAINLAGEDGIASNVTHMCANGFEFGDVKKRHKKKDKDDGSDEDTQVENVTSRDLPSGLTVRVSADGQSFSGDAANLTDLREMLGSMLPEGTQERNVRLVG